MKIDYVITKDVSNLKKALSLILTCVGNKNYANDGIRLILYKYLNISGYNINAYLIISKD